MDAAAVAVPLELNQLSIQVCHVPEEYLIEVLTPYRANQPVDERMGNRCVRIATSPPTWIARIVREIV